MWGAEPKAGAGKTGPMGFPVGVPAIPAAASGPGPCGWTAGSGSGSVATGETGRVAAQFGHTATAVATSLEQ
jgi:hypothetical protein